VKDFFIGLAIFAVVGALFGAVMIWSLDSADEQREHDRWVGRCQASGGFDYYHKCIDRKTQTVLFTE
jgi:hypothetical protein